MAKNPRKIIEESTNDIHKLEKLILDKKSPITGLIRYTAIITSISILFGGTVLATVKINTHSDFLPKCKNITREYQNQGIELDYKPCFNLSFENIPKLFAADMVVANISEDLNLRKKELEKRLAEKELQIEELQLQLSGLEEEITFPFISEQTTNLNEQIRAIDAKIYYLEKAIKKAESKLQNTKLTFQNLINNFSSLNLQDYIGYFQNFSNMDKANQNKEYKDLKIQTESLKNHIETQLKSKGIMGKNISFEKFFAYKYFEPQEFVDFFDKVEYSKLNNNDTTIVFTKSEQTDQRIFEFAEQRGYKKQDIARAENLVDIGEFKLQEEAKQDFLEMQAQAAKEGVSLRIKSAYRSPNHQASIFLFRLNKLGLGYTDQAIIEVLKGAAPPGYSRHQNGYTIDIKDGNKPIFRETPAFAWLSKNNYLNAKKFGFIPSYPEGGSEFGPEPESWEYTWVGTERLTN